MADDGMLAKEKAALSVVQKRRMVALMMTALTAALVLPLVKSAGDPEGTLHEAVEAVGLALIAVCIGGRAWCSLYIGGRKTTELVVHGPYSLSRNPLYMFTFVGAAGLGAQSGSVVIALLSLLLAVLVFRPVIMMEEAALHRLHGRAFEWYCRWHPRFGPKFIGWNDVKTLEVRPSAVYRTVRDGLVFLALIPVFEGLDALHQSGVLPTLLSFY